MAATDAILFLPQVLSCYYHPAKKRLVNHSTSDNEMVRSFDQRISPNGLSTSLTELRTKRNFTAVAPSTSHQTKHNPMKKVPSQNEMWECIRNNYTFLMDTDLTSVCKETGDEFCTEELNSRYLRSWTCTEFIKKFNEFHDRLHSLQTSAIDQKDKATFLRTALPDLHKLWKECEMLNEQSVQLERRYPLMRDDINKRCNLLKNKWQALERAIWPKEPKQDNAIMIKIGSEAKQLRIWMREVGDKLTALKANKNWTPKQMLEAYNNQMALQREIETRGRDVTSLLRRLESLEVATAEERRRALRSVKNLEQSWHSIWLRSLENNCLTELFLQEYNQEQSRRLAESFETDSDEGPQTKQRRLTCNSGTTSCSQSRDAMDDGDTSQTSYTTWSDKHSKGTSTCLGPTREMSTFCMLKKDYSPTNDKCIMVGTTGITALKAKYGDDFSNFEIIQDVGYSSESSTHLSSDDVGECIQAYSYTPPRRGDNPTVYSLKPGLSLDHYRGFEPSSLGSSGSHNDSGFGMAVNDIFCDVDLDIDGCKLSIQELSDSEFEDVINFSLLFPEDENDSRLENVCINSSARSDSDSSDDFINRETLNSDTQRYYKMISVDSDPGDLDSPDRDNTICDNDIISNNPSRINSESHSNNEVSEDEEGTMAVRESVSFYDQDESQDPIQLSEIEETDKNGNFNQRTLEDLEEEVCKKTIFCSTPSKYHNCNNGHSNSTEQGAFPKQKRNRSLMSGKTKTEARKFTDSRRVNEWLFFGDENSNICKDLTTSPGNDSAEGCDFWSRVVPIFPEIDSSCDASGEYTSTTESDADVSFISSSEDNEVSYSPMSRSPVGSVDTVLPLEMKYASPKEFILLPPPPPPTPSKEKSHLSSDSSFVEERLKADRRVRSEGHLNVQSNGYKFTEETYATSSVSPFEEYLPTRASKSKKSRSLPSVFPSESFQSSSTSDHCQSNPKSLAPELLRKASANKRRTRRRSSNSNRSRKRRISSNFSELPSFRKRHNSRENATEALHNIQRLRTIKDTGISPGSPESDVVLTHLEEQSTVSDQVWDGYQEMSYLSEGYSETTIDEEALRKLTEFGDDYGAAIGQSLSLYQRSHSSSPKSASSPTRASKNNIPMKIPPPPAENNNLDSDSDVEDLYNVLQDSYKALQFAKCSFKDNLSPSEIAELHATCETHMSCLQSIQEHVTSNGDGSIFSEEQVYQMNGLIDEWGSLEESIPMPVMEGPLKKDIFELQEKIKNLSIVNKIGSASVSSVEDISDIIKQLKNALSILYDIKGSELRVLNIRVHQYVTHKEDGAVNLKDQITSLYKYYEDVNERNRELLTTFHAISNGLDIYRKKCEEVASKLNDTDADSLLAHGTADCESWERYLNDLRQEESSLSPILKNYNLWSKIESELECLSGQIRKAMVCQSTRTFEPFPSPENSSKTSLPNPSVVEDHLDGNLEDSSPAVTRAKSSRKGRSRFWRILRIALPIHLSLILLCYLAFMFEPHCCTVLNNMNFSFIPQLRYYKGPPPV